MNQVKITQINNRFIVTTENGKVHVLTNRALKWNLKHVFGLHQDDVTKIMIEIGMEQFNEIIINVA